ncbi:MAG: ABC transporter substrate-binding protein [Bacillota bacterium]
MSRRILSMFLVVFLLALVAGCGGSKTEPKPTETPKAGEAPKTEQPKEVEISFYYPVAVGGPLTKIIDNMVAEFTKANPHIKVKPVFSGNYADTLTKVQTLIQGGQKPEVAVLLSTDIYTLTDQDAIIPLDDLIKADKDGAQYLADFFPAFMANSQINGTTYGIPFQRSMVVMYYNKELLEKAGYKEAPKTWDELVDAAKKITNPAEGVWGIKIPSDGYPYWLTQGFAIQSGKNLMSADGKEVYFNSPENIQGLTFWRDLAYTHKVMPEGVIAWTAAPTDFISGKVGMIYHSSGSLANITKNAKFKFGVAFLPAGPKGHGAPTGGGNFYIFKGLSKEKQEAAWKFVRHMTDAEVQAKWGLDTGYVAPRKSSFETKTMKDAAAKDPNVLVARDQLQYAAAELSVHNNPQIYKAYGNQLQAIITGKSDVKTAMDAAQKEAETILAPFKKK